MKKKYLVAAGIFLGLFFVIVAVLSLINGYFVLSPGIRIKLNGEKTQEIEAFSGYRDPGAKAMKGKKVLKARITTEGTVDDKVPGTYTIIYHLNLNSKNYKAVRTVKVVDREAPRIVLQGDRNLIVSKKELYLEPGYKAEDRCDGDLTKNVLIEEEFQENIITLNYK